MVKTQLELVREQAEWELSIERFEQLVDKEKDRLRNKQGLLNRILPFKIIIVRKK